MKKVINITLGGIVFAIEQNAYDTLASYLERIKSNLSGGDDYLEVMGDIESAIAEKFIARKRSEKLAVIESDVTTVVGEMGSPADFGEGREANTDTDNAEQSTDSVNTKKQLYRDTDDVIIAGVASGLAHYFGIDPVITRLIFVVSMFFNGLGIIAYIILWLVVRQAETTAQKYAMRGESVTLSQINDRVKKKLDEVDGAAISSKTKNTWGGLRQVFVKIFEVLGVIVRTLIRAFRYLAGFVFFLGGALSLAIMVSVYSVVLLSDKAFVPADAQTALDIMMSSTLGIVAICASFVMMSIPFLILILAGGSLLAKRSLFTLNKSITLAVVWIVAIMLAFTTSILQVEKVMKVIDPDGFDNGKYQIHMNP